MSNPLVFNVIVMLAVAEILLAVLTSEAPLTLRRCVRLSSTLGLIAGAPEYGFVTAIFLGSGLWWAMRPDVMRGQRTGLALILLTPAICGTILVICLRGFPIVQLPSSSSAEWLVITGPAVALGVLALALIGRLLGPAKIIVQLALAFWMSLSVAAALGQDPFPYAISFWPFIAATILLSMRNVIWAWLRQVALVGGAVFLSVAVSTAQAGPWTQKSGESLLIARVPFSSSDATHQEQSKVLTYSEAGLSDDVTFIVGGQQEKFKGQQQVGGSAGLRVNVWSDGSYIFSLEGAVGIEPITVVEAALDLEGHIETEMRAQFGWSGTAEGLPFYTSIEVGYRTRPTPFDGVAVLDLSAGIDLYSDLQLNAHVRGELGDDNAISAETSVLWRLDPDFGLEIGARIRDADSVGQETSAFAGVWIRF